MKKFLILLFLISFLAGPILVYAQEAKPANLPCKLSHTQEELGRYRSECATKTKTEVEETASCCLIDKLLTVGDYLFVGLLIIAIIVILISGWTFLTGSDNPDKIKKARNGLIYGVIGLVIGFLAKIIVRFVAEVIG